MNWTRIVDWIVAIICTATFFIILAMAASAADLTVKDGDTIVWKGETIRLHGVDAPEGDQPFGDTARDWLTEHLAGNDLWVKRFGTDKYGRTIGRVMIGNTSVNKALVLAGMAWAYREFSPTYIDEERAARKRGLGLWAPGSCPVMPSIWRE